MEDDFVKYHSDWDKIKGLYNENSINLMLKYIKLTLYVPKKIPPIFAEHIGKDIKEFFAHKSRIKMIDVPKNQKSLIYLLIGKMKESEFKEVVELAEKIPLVGNLHVENWAFN